MNQSSNPEAAIRVIILDANRMSAELLADALKRDHFDVVYEGSKVADAVYAAGRADVALVSVTTSDQENACDVVRQFRSVSPPVQVILMIEVPDAEVVIEAFRAGVRGIFPRSTSVRVLKKCILAVHNGQIWARNEELNYLLSALTEPRHFRLVDARGVELLSKREEDVVRCVAEGFKNREIASELGLSENTVKNYLFRIFDKLGISNRVELILYALGNMAARLTQPGAAGNGKGDILSTCRDAAERGTTPEYLLGKIYREGRGIRPDKVTSYMWFVIAETFSAEVHKNSRAALADLAREMSGKQMVEAKQRAAKWLKNRGRMKAQETSPGQGDELPTKTRAAISHAWTPFLLSQPALFAIGRAALAIGPYVFAGLLVSIDVFLACGLIRGWNRAGAFKEKFAAVSVSLSAVSAVLGFAGFCLHDGLRGFAVPAVLLFIAGAGCIPLPDSSWRFRQRRLVLMRDNRGNDSGDIGNPTSDLQSRYLQNHRQ